MQCSYYAQYFVSFFAPLPTPKTKKHSTLSYCYIFQQIAQKSISKSKPTNKKHDIQRERKKFRQNIY